MRLITFALVFAVLLAVSSFADGLEITKLDARVDYDYSTAYRLEQENRMTRIDYAPVPLQDDSRINVQVYPGANLTFILTVENTFKDDTQSLRDMVAAITIEGRHGRKLKELSRSFYLDAGTQEKTDIKFNVPFDIDSGLTNVLVEVQGMGKNHTPYITGLRLKLDILKLSHDIRISKVSLEPGVVGCKREMQLSAEIVNAGSSAENGIALEFKSPGLGINSYEKNLSLSSSADNIDLGITHEKTVSVNVPSFFEPGTYPIFVNLYWETYILFDQKTVYLAVEDCAARAKPAAETKNETPAAAIPPAEETKETPIEEMITRTEEMSTLDSPVLLSALLGGVFFMMALAALIVFGLLRKSKAH